MTLNIAKLMRVSLCISLEINMQPTKIKVTIENGIGTEVELEDEAEILLLVVLLVIVEGNTHIPANET